MGNEDRYLGKYLDDRYEILEVIGIGGMAVVYKAICHRLNRHVAVKILKDEFVTNEEFRRRFRTEAQAVAMLSQPNIVAVYDVSHSQDVEYMVMELIDGISLKQYMQKRGTLTWKEALHFSLQITKALSHAHGRGIIHRDIKPHNIMILRDGSAKVADFGIARLLSIQEDISITKDAIGSVHYISPEQAKGEIVDARTDIYSLGVVMYEMLTGRLPFEGDSPVAVAIQHISSIPLMPRDINPDIPKKLELITMKAMNPNLNERYQTVEEIMNDLEDFRKNPDESLDWTPVVIDEIVPFKNTDNSPSGNRFPASAMRKSASGSISKGEHVKSSKNARKTSTVLGVSIFLLFVIAVFAFLWFFWFKDVVAHSQTMQMPNFVGTKVDDILMNTNYTDKFKFTTKYEPNSEYGEGYVISQDPASERKVVVAKDGVEVQLVVSRGTNYLNMPDVVGKEYREAVIQLEKLKLVVKQEVITSDTVEVGHVIRTKPASGEQLLPNNTVYITISGGPKMVYLNTPNVTGLTLNKAIDALEAVNLSVGSITLVADNAAIGTVIFQSVSPGVEIAQYTTVDIKVSGGIGMSTQPSGG